MTMKDFGKLVADNGPAMLAFGSTTESGSKNFARLSGQLRAAGSDLYALGYGTAEINQGFANYGKLIRSQGLQGTKSNSELIAGSKKYLKEMDVPYLSGCFMFLRITALKKVGLFDESFVPAYFEDNDYQRRCDHKNIEVVSSFIPLAHDNSSTLNAGFRKQNDLSYEANSQYNEHKIKTKDFTEGRWSIKRRRQLSWD